MGSPPALESHGYLLGLLSKKILKVVHTLFQSLMSRVANFQEVAGDLLES